MEAGVDTGSSAAPRRRRLGLALSALLAAGVAVAILVGTSSSSQQATLNAGSAGGAAIVQRRDLIETDTESGTLGYADPQTVYNRLSGTITVRVTIARLRRKLGAPEVIQTTPGIGYRIANTDSESGSHSDA